MSTRTKQNKKSGSSERRPVCTTQWRKYNQRGDDVSQTCNVIVHYATARRPTDIYPSDNVEKPREQINIVLKTGLLLLLPLLPPPPDVARFRKRKKQKAGIDARTKRLRQGAAATTTDARMQQCQLAAPCCGHKGIRQRESQPGKKSKAPDVATRAFRNKRERDKRNSA